MSRWKVNFNKLEFALIAFWVIGLSLFILGGSSIWLFASSIMLVCCALHRRFSLEIAALLSLTSILAIDSIFLRIEPYLPWGFELSNFILLLGIGITSISILFFQENAKDVEFRFSDPRIIVSSSIALFGFIWVTIFSVSNGYHLAWAMKNDAVWTTVMARLALQDGGIDPSVRSLSSPLTSGLFAQAMSFGREGISPENLLRHDLVRNGELWLGLLFLASVLASWIVVRNLANKPSLFVWISGIVAGSIPLSWYVAGFSFQLGFYNSAIPIVVLFIVWLAWGVAKKYPNASIAILSFSSLILLSSWVPLAAISFVLTFLVIFRERHHLFERTRILKKYVWTLIFLSPFVYLASFSLPDYLRESKALASDGGMMPISPANLAAIALVLFLLVALKKLTFGKSSSMLGVSAVILTGFLGCSFLVFQRIDKDELWGYYPAKLGWLLSVLLIVIILSEILDWQSQFGFDAISIYPTVPLAIFVSVVLMLQVPPAGVLSNLPNGFIRGFFPLTMTLLPADKGIEDLAADKILRLSSAYQKNVVFNSEENETMELFINGWLLQLQTEKAENPIREFAYLLDGKTPSMLCGVEELWGPGVEVHTGNPGLANILESTCSGAKPKVILE